MLNAILLASVLAAMPAAEPTPKLCRVVLQEIQDAHTKAGHVELVSQQVTNGIMFFWGSEDETTYATVFLSLPKGKELTQGFFKKKGTCVSPGGTEFEYFSASQAK